MHKSKHISKSITHISDANAYGKGHLPLILDLLKVIGLLVLSPEAHQLGLIIVKTQLATDHSRKVL